MSILAIVIILVGLWLAFKVVGLFFRLLVWAVIIGAAYWVIAPHLNLPTLG